MNLEEKRTRLKSLLEESIRAGKVGTAIAITGSWGVGKTYFWKKLLEEQLSEERIYKKDNVFNRKYAYVSLFGLESLSDLKTNIYSNIENYHSTVEIPKWIKGLPSIFKDTKISQYGISAPAKVFDSLMFNQVKDAIICFDDFERMSKKLDIKDVMGVANQLKLEKNCQIILILDEDKAEGENKKKYAEYKEKLIDETIIINSVEPLIRANAQDMDDRLVKLMVEFADELKIHNFRFFQKVIKLYKDFRKQLPSDVADSTKEIILVRILQGYLIEDYPYLEHDWNDIKDSEELLIGEDENISIVKGVTLGHLRNIANSFLEYDEWFVEFKKWFDQKGRVNFSTLTEIIDSDLVSEKKMKFKDELNFLWKSMLNGHIEPDFGEKIFKLSIELLGAHTFEVLEHRVVVLSQLGFIESANHLESKVKGWISNQLNSNKEDFLNDHCYFRREQTRFYDFIDETLNERSDISLPTLFDWVVSVVIEGESFSDYGSQVLNLASEKDWEILLFQQIPNNTLFKHTSSSKVVHNILKTCDETLKDNVKVKVKNVYKEIGKKSELHARHMEYLISLLEKK
ncbi:hypothetical protein XA39_04170 [Acinetobacter tandoii]|uniref:P-loop NTPase fold protein n=1 Tax=Acinetobacter tandoii TaxID=202954 RepID=UPI000C20A4E6|nr:P-loop NTPase fold protein [Acinetobacter tandoii]PJG44152.1 hypothetical protein XA39_04170 [Acinetobacter tandoii]